MKALIVTPYYAPKIGGLENYAHRLNKALQAAGWEIVVVTSNHQGHRTTTDTVDGIHIHRLNTWFKFSNTPLNFFWLFTMRRIIRGERPDVIIAHTPVPSLADTAALVAGPTPFILVYHAATLFKQGSIIFSTVARFYKFYEHITLMRADKIVAVSEYVKQGFPKNLQDKVVVIPNAVDEQDIVNRTQPDNQEFLFVGSLDKTHAWKGLDLILTAIAKSKTYRLSIMGDGNDRAHYEERARALGITNRITFLGNLTGPAKDEVFRQAAGLIIYPTSPNDALPTVMLEAWARSVPVIAAAIGPIPSLIRDHIDGYLVKANDPDALFNGLTSFMATSIDKRAGIAHAARLQVSEQYTWSQQAARMQKVAQELL